MFFWVRGGWRFWSDHVGLKPYTDNAYDLGGGSNRYDDVYATNGTIQTSDSRDKANIATLTYGLDFINDLLPVSFTWNDRGGYVGTRTHWGLTAQDVETTLGVDATNLAVWINAPAETLYDPETGDQLATYDHQGLRYPELIAPIIKAIQELSDLVDAQQVEIDALEAENATQQSEIDALDARVTALEA
jgi:hypothetical protein